MNRLYTSRILAVCKAAFFVQSLEESLKDRGKFKEHWWNVLRLRQLLACNLDWMIEYGCRNGYQFRMSLILEITLDILFGLYMNSGHGKCASGEERFSVFEITLFLQNSNLLSETKSVKTDLMKFKL